MLAAFGALAFVALIVPPRRDLLRIAQVSIGASVAATSIWAAVETVAIAARSPGLGPVLLDTVFGYLVLLRLGLPVLAAAALPRVRLAAVLAGFAVASIAGHGHALAMYEGPS